MNQPPQALDLAALEHLISLALQEDIGKGDITTTLTIAPEAQGCAVMVARQKLIVCGLPIAALVFEKAAEGYGAHVTYHSLQKEGVAVEKGTILCRIEGSVRTLLTAERTALNFVQHLSGIATLTRRYADAIAHTKTRLLDTRKTTPGLRVLEKYAVRIGGGENHRMRLDDAILIKDNHIALGGGITAVIAKARASQLPIEVECDTLAQVKEALDAGAKRLLLDNMSIPEMKDAMKMGSSDIQYEASGGITLNSIKQVAECGVDYISVGALTHSATSVDIGLDIHVEN